MYTHRTHRSSPLERFAVPVSARAAAPHHLAPVSRTAARRAARGWSPPPVREEYASSEPAADLDALIAGEHLELDANRRNRLLDVVAEHSRSAYRNWNVAARRLVQAALRCQNLEDHQIAALLGLDSGVDVELSHDAEVLTQALGHPNASTQTTCTVARSLAFLVSSVAGPWETQPMRSYGPMRALEHHPHGTVLRALLRSGRPRAEILSTLALLQEGGQEVFEVFERLVTDAGLASGTYVWHLDPTELVETAAALSA